MRELEDVLIYDIPDTEESIIILKDIFGEAMRAWRYTTKWYGYDVRYIYKASENNKVFRSCDSIEEKMIEYPKLKKISYSDFVNPREDLKYDINKG